MAVSCVVYGVIQVVAAVVGRYVRGASVVTSVIQPAATAAYILIIVFGSLYFVVSVLKWIRADRSNALVVRRIRMKTVWLIVAFAGFIIFLINNGLKVAFSRVMDKH